MKTMETFFDSHAHLDFPEFDSDREEVMARAKAAGVEYIVTIGSGNGLDSARRAIEIAERHEGVWATAGVHPHDVRLMKEEHLERLRELARHPRVAAVGEIGLDYAKEYSPREVQLRRFRDQLALSRELCLPVVIHDREAHEDFLRVLREDGVSAAGGIMHCYSGSVEMALRLVREGFYISFSGVLTFKKPKTLVQVAQAVPLERILIETDSPFLAPEPHRGRRNEPAFVVRVAETLARLRNLPLAEAAALTTRNAFAVFGRSR